ncbi:hypothetical protein P154DRAFT_220120 [Amniculicola lignicola CBS 123094]|uniref:Uncharacterized protein n=1 Tax=Amniculicola lignicola CBS 123094 TaxID=1392246 RepID=A0A6A5WYA8_9PLEO|nr:hypothetical protein P154DRAFT_220120 [Amniculicola lignicola CBS 123094]
MEWLSFQTRYRLTCFSLGFEITTYTSNGSCVCLYLSTHASVRADSNTGHSQHALQAPHTRTDCATLGFHVVSCASVRCGVYCCFPAETGVCNRSFLIIWYCYAPNADKTYWRMIVVGVLEELEILLHSVPFPVEWAATVLRTGLRARIQIHQLVERQA